MSEPSAPEQTDPIAPRLRGVIHRYAAPVAAVLFALLVARTPGADRAVVAIYGVCVTAMLSVSAVYHRGRLSPAARRYLKRLDHTTILLAIAGTYTAVTALALRGGDRHRMLVVIWIVAPVGILLRMAWIDAPYPVVAAVYLAVGWLMLVDLPAYLRGMSGGQTALVATGGLLYTAGGLVYGTHRPRLWPHTFGYHEVFHALVVVAAFTHYLAVVALVAAT